MEYDDYKCTVIKIDNEYTYSFEPLDIINCNGLGRKLGGKKTRSNKQKRKRNTKRKNNIVL